MHDLSLGSLSGMKNAFISINASAREKLMARQCFFEETLFNKTFDKEIDLDDEYLTRLALVTALTLAKAIFVNHRYV